MFPSSTSHSTNSEVVAHRPRIIEDEEAVCSSKHSTNEVFFVGTEDTDVMPVEKDPLSIHSSDEDEQSNRYFVCCVFHNRFLFLYFCYSKKRTFRSQCVDERARRTYPKSDV